MQRYLDFVQDSAGNAVAGASISVLNSLGAAATLYSDNGFTSLANPITSDATGQFAFYAANGTYSATTSSPGLVTRTEPGIVLNDPAESGPVSVKDARYGAKGDGVADDTAAIQAALTANPGRSIFLPAGVYRITGILSWNTDSTGLVGAGRNCTFIRQDGVNLDAIRIYSASTATKTSFVNNPRVTGLYIYRTIASTTGAGIRATQVNGGSFFDFIVSDMPEGMVFEGGQFNNIYDFNLFASGVAFDLSLTANSALLSFKEAPITGGLFQQPFTTKIWGFGMSASKKLENNIFIASADGLEFKLNYHASAFMSLVKVMTLRNGSTVSNVEFDGYDDGVNSSGTQYGLWMPDDGFASSTIFSVKLNGGTWGNYKSSAVYSRKPQLQRLIINSAELINCPSYAIDVSGSSTTTELMVAGTNINGASLTAGAGCINVANVKSFTWSGGSAYGAPLGNAALTTSGSIGLMNISGPIISNTNTDWLNSATFSFPPQINVSSDNSQTTNSFLAYTFTPTITFGGASVGVTYTSQVGEYSRVGNRVTFTAWIVLSSKGSSTGSIAINGLPYTAAAIVSLPADLFVNNVTAGVGDTMLQATITATATNVTLSKVVAGARVLLTDADVTNTTDIRISGTYRV